MRQARQAPADVLCGYFSLFFSQLWTSCTDCGDLGGAGVPPSHICLSVTLPGIEPGMSSLEAEASTVLLLLLSSCAFRSV